MNYQSSDDHGMGSMSSNYFQSSHMSPTHHMSHQHYHPPTHMHTAQLAVPSQANLSASSNTLSTSSTSGYPEEFYAANDFNEQSEHYIYVTYPPELKRRLLERYGREIYLMLLKKD